jgi:pSer/pThr/pTyr-binding forkhead associated (FHA) protein
MSYGIRVITGRDAGEIYPLPENRKISIGHDTTCDIVIADKYVSRFHCEIMVIDGKCVLTDRQSRNGTFVNEERVTRCELKSGCRIRVGETLLTLEVVARERRSPARERPK